MDITSVVLSHTNMIAGGSAMGERGYVYVLQNRSFPYLLKIGYTTRTPHERAEELSRHSGVPTPYVVVYSQFFLDCQAAEREVHNSLEARRWGKEFFRITLDEAISAIEACKARERARLEEERRYYRKRGRLRKVLAGVACLLLVFVPTAARLNRIQKAQDVPPVSVAPERRQDSGWPYEVGELGHLEPIREEYLETQDDSSLLTDELVPSETPDWSVFFTETEEPFVATRYVDSDNVAGVELGLQETTVVEPRAREVAVKDLRPEEAEETDPSVQEEPGAGSSPDIESEEASIREVEDNSGRMEEEQDVGVELTIE